MQVVALEQVVARPGAGRDDGSSRCERGVLARRGFRRFTAEGAVTQRQVDEDDEP